MVPGHYAAEKPPFLETHAILGLSLVTGVAMAAHSSAGPLFVFGT